MEILIVQMNVIIAAYATYFIFCGKCLLLIGRWLICMYAYDLLIGL